VRAGDRVIAWLPNGPALVRAWFSINYLGAVFVPLNTAYRGASLEHTINACRAKLVLAHPGLIERLEGLSLPHVERVITVGADSLEGDAQRLDDSAQPQPWDAQSIIYTSGTTGLSKGVLSPYLQLYTTATVVYGYLREGEGILVNLPMFHVGGTSSLMIALIRSGSFHLVDGFSTERFWDQVRRGNCTTTSGLIGIMGAFLMKSAPRPDDRQHPIRCMTGFPINEQTVRIRGYNVAILLPSPGSWPAVSQETLWRDANHDRPRLAPDDRLAVNGKIFTMHPLQRRQRSGQSGAAATADRLSRYR
jgi:crotonobetaine/carnitine-CoA ligase